MTFLDPSVRPAIPAGADKIVAGEDDAHVAEWVRAIGGQAVIENGKLLEISLATTSVTDDLLRNLQGLKHLQQAPASIDRRSAIRALKHLAGLTSLMELDLSGTAISDAGLANLAGLDDLRKLQPHAHADHRLRLKASAKHFRSKSCACPTRPSPIKAWPTCPDSSRSATSPSPIPT